MKKKLFLLSTMISSCVLAIALNQTKADAQLHPNMPTSGKQKCYPGSKCTGDPNLMHQDWDQDENYGNMRGKAPQRNGNGKPMEALRTSAVDKFKATVTRVDRIRMPNETQIQLIVDTDQGEKKVIVGPARFVDQSKVKVQSGDKIEIYGYVVRANGDEVIIASEIKKNGNSLKLLDDKRQPLWQQNQK